MLPWKETYWLFLVSSRQIMYRDHLPEDTICQSLLACPVFYLYCMVLMSFILYSLYGFINK